MTTIILSLLACLLWLMAQIHANICTYASKFALACYSSYNIFMTFYQIARLQYCFMDSQIHSKKYGYSKWLFLFLYFAGFGIMLYWGYMNFISSHQYDNYLCFGNGRVIVFEFGWIWIATMVYAFWDGFVLFLYIYKVCDVKEKMKLTENDRNTTIILNRVNVILHKIIFLTILAGWISFAIGISYSLPYLSTSGLQLQCIDACFKSFLMYLMIEHNHEIYLKLMQSYLCCCCKCFIGKNNDIERLQSEIKRNDVEKTIDDTDDHTLKVAHTDYEHGSEMTVTAGY